MGRPRVRRCSLQVYGAYKQGAFEKRLKRKSETLEKTKSTKPRKLNKDEFKKAYAFLSSQKKDD